MLFKKKSPPPCLPSVCLSCGNTVLYEGLLKEIPLRETVIIEKSIHFFDDPEPCFIHRNAVRIRLTEELYQELLSQKDNTPGPLMRSYADFSEIKNCRLL